jgi:type II secretory pathway component PulJ
MVSNGDPASVEAAVSAAFPKVLQATRPFGYRLEQALPLQCPRPTQRRHAAFTLVELLVATGVLVLLVFLASQLLNTAATVTTLGHKQMDADGQARQLLDRMAIDFEQMVKRSDVDYYLKSSRFAFGTPPAPPPPPVITGVRTLLQPGNDQIAFYSAVPGYYPTGSQSPVSLVAYRVNSNSASSSYNKMERFGKGLVWNAVSTTDIPVVFMPIPVASALPVAELPPSPTPIPSPSPGWPQAGNMTADAAYELVGPQVFRFEYYYLLKGQVVTGTTYNPIFSDAPLDTRISGHAKVSGMQDVSAIVVDIAVIDSKSKVLISDCILAKLNGAPPPAGCSAAQVLVDWGNTTCAGCPTQTQWQTTPGLLAAQWRSAIDGNTVGAPRQAVSGIRVYERFIYLSPAVQ